MSTAYNYEILFYKKRYEKNSSSYLFLMILYSKFMISDRLLSSSFICLSFRNMHFPLSSAFWSAASPVLAPHYPVISSSALSATVSFLVSSNNMHPTSGVPHHNCPRFSSDVRIRPFSTISPFSVTANTVV